MCVRQADLSANYRERYWLFSYCWPAAVKGLPPKIEELKLQRGGQSLGMVGDVADEAINAVGEVFVRIGGCWCFAVASANPNACVPGVNGQLDRLM
jgi:hypothetical protein